MLKDEKYVLYTCSTNPNLGDAPGADACLRSGCQTSTSAVSCWRLWHLVGSGKSLEVEFSDDSLRETLFGEESQSLVSL